MSHVCTPRGSTPRGTAVVGRRPGAVPGGVERVGHGYRSRCANGEPRLAEREVAALEHLRHDVGAVLHLEVHERRLAVLQLVERRQLASRRT